MTCAVPMWAGPSANKLTTNDIPVPPLLPPQKLDAAEQQHRRLSSKEAVEARDVSAALGQLPRTFSRLQRIFGFQVCVCVGGVGLSCASLASR